MDIVQTNCMEIIQLTQAWSDEILDVFTAREPLTSYTMEDLVVRQKYGTLIINSEVFGASKIMKKNN